MRGPKHTYFINALRAAKLRSVYKNGFPCQQYNWNQSMARLGDVSSSTNPPPPALSIYLSVRVCYAFPLPFPIPFPAPYYLILYTMLSYRITIWNRTELITCSPSRQRLLWCHQIFTPILGIPASSTGLFQLIPRSADNVWMKIF